MPEGASLILRYSKKLKRLFSLMYGRRKRGKSRLSRICMISLDRKKIELTFPDYFAERDQPTNIADFAVLESNPPRILIAYLSGSIVLDTIQSRLGGQKWIDPESSIDIYSTFSLSICPEEKYFLAFYRQSDGEAQPWYAHSDFQRYRIFQIAENRVELMNGLPEEEDEALEEQESYDRAGYFVTYLYSYKPSFFHKSGKNSELHFIQIFEIYKKSTLPEVSNHDYYHVDHESTEKLFKEIIYDCESLTLRTIESSRSILPYEPDGMSRMHYFNGGVYYFDPRGFLSLIERI